MSKSPPAPPRPRSPDAVLRRLEWTVMRRLDGLLHGDYRTLFRGFGLDLADLREYQYHDDVRHIDWNVTARLQTPYVREYNEDRDINAWFLLDLSPSVDFGSGEVRKRSVAAEVVAVRLYDPLEMELPDIGLFVMQDAETGEQLFIDTHDKGFRKRFAQLARGRELELREAFRDAGVDALELATDDDLADAILRFADLRKRRNQLAAGATAKAARRAAHLEA